MAENARLAELRRRVESDPSSSAFAQLAEELQRLGEHKAAVDYCRAGLLRHPAYLSARVTCARSLAALGLITEARTQLERVLRTAPGHEAASELLAQLADQLDASVAEPAPDSGRPAPSDFDAILNALGAPAASPPPGMLRLLEHGLPAVADARARIPLAAPASLSPEPASGNSLDRFEHSLQVLLSQHEPRKPNQSGVALERLSPVDRQVLAELEAWLAALDKTRDIGVAGGMSAAGEIGA